MDLSQIINELGEDRESYFGAVAPPIIQTSNFAFKNVAQLREAMQDEFAVDLYSRGNNPTVTILRKKIAALDNAEDALVLSSGVAAVFLAVFANVKQGDHIVSVAKPYSWTDKLFNVLLPRFGVTATMIDGTNIENFERAIQPNTKIIFLESPNSFTFELQDLEAVARLAKSKRLLTIIDNSYCSPLYQRPLDFGIDISVQTATKYLGGHSDVIAGVIAGKKEMIEKIFKSDLLTVGSIISPFNAWLLIRSLRTLEIRLERIAQSTQHIAQFMENHPMVEKIYYPFSPSFPQYELAKKQMKQSPGLFTVVLKVNSIQAVEKFCNSLKHFLMAVSWGGHESLIFPSCAVIKPEDFNQEIAAHRMVRFYIGLEGVDYLVGDIEGAFAGL
ncbi:MAG: aminotransferase class I/II-fold pyridoxal phosphate-dependent enzyme [Chitinophagaceae bacterium]|nr:aminotransferase class I/II-fold pyridoxal phosphate-dependent enzyme [Chitinophagaceae bacterium]